MSKSMTGKPHKNKGVPFTEEHKRKISEGSKGKIIPQEVREKIRATLTGRHPSEETLIKMRARPPMTLEERKWRSEIGKMRRHTPEEIKKMCLAQKGHPGYNKGKKHTEEAKRKMSMAKKGKRFTEEHCKNMSLAFIHRKIPFFNTSIEKLVQDELSAREYAYYRHYPIVGRPDIAFPDKKIAIFADGDYWHNLPRRQENDARISTELQSQGWFVLRYWEHEINANVEAVVDEIEDVLLSRIG